MVITGIVVAFAASAIAVALILRLSMQSRNVTLDAEVWTRPNGGDAT
jgi:multisubunit Na+/H+ antiporter MnhC subunit